MAGQREEIEATLDPSDWGEIRQLGHRVVDDVTEYLQTLRDLPVWRPIPEEVRREFKSSVPRKPEGAAKAYEDFRSHVLPYPLGNHHPRFWGWVNGTGIPIAALAEMLAATINNNTWGGETSPILVERQVLEWLKELLGFPQEASGLLVSGGSMANLVGLAVAVDAKAGFDVAEEGLSAAPKRLVLYASEEVHSSVDKAVRLLGLGFSALRKIPVDDEFTIDITQLERAIASDRADGLHPFCVVGTAGTVNTGATDPLNQLADIAQREGMWFHVDGAFGALSALSPSLKQLTSGMERADSLGFDLHKWMYLPSEAACTLVRDSEAHRRAFATHAPYLSKQEGGGGVTGTENPFNQYGIQLTRSFKALKVWMSIKEYGSDKFAELIEQNVEQARYLAGLIEESSHIELLAPVPLNLVNFRFVAPGMSEESLDTLNQTLLVRLQESGVAVPSQRLIKGRFALCVANTNHRTRREDFDLLVREVEKIGLELLEESDTNPSTTERGTKPRSTWEAPGKGMIGVKGLM